MPLPEWPQEEDRLGRFTLQELKTLYEKLHHKPAPPGNRAFLQSQVAYAWQAKMYGGLPEAAHRRMAAILETAGFDAEGREVKGKRQAPRLLCGTRLVRTHRGVVHEVLVVAEGYEYQGAVFPSLTAIAQVITGAHWNGWFFFGLAKRGKTR